MPNYRSVSSTGKVVKLLEKIIPEKLPSNIESYGLLTPEQHAFRIKCSCLTNLLIMRQGSTATQHNALSLEIFIDINKALDRVCNLGIMQKSCRITSTVQE